MTRGEVPHPPGPAQQACVANTVAQIRVTVLERLCRHATTGGCSLVRGVWFLRRCSLPYFVTAPPAGVRFPALRLRVTPTVQVQL